MDLVDSTGNMTLSEPTDDSASHSSKERVAIYDQHHKRLDYLEWTDYFMATAVLASLRSKDPSSQVGACVVTPDNKIVGVGYNGMPNGCHDDEFPWGKNASDPLEHKKFYVCHAEMNAIINKNAVDLKDCTIYVVLFPCNECTKIIIQSGIKNVVYLSDKHAHKEPTVASKRMLDAVGIKHWKYEPNREKIVIDFFAIDGNKVSQR